MRIGSEGTTDSLMLRQTVASSSFVPSFLTFIPRRPKTAQRSGYASQYWLCSSMRRDHFQGRSHPNRILILFVARKRNAGTLSFLPAPFHVFVGIWPSFVAS